ncbi:Ankyrin repeat protein 2 [Giardia muris]|uniref:Ankyrin repeat protein 2 n=1 Tax=Giardia muris TaxID=5742 RepID=A0A4Z1SRX2_GIAMU|nr:Ankyrin repeat protein 2 [Giardia muris]|eukprot:TNJ26388.1 Ankyrin repeat protein 2 [Giardia muris]
MKGIDGENGIARILSQVLGALPTLAQGVSPSNALMHAAFAGDVAQVRANMNLAKKTNDMDWTALIFAAKAGHAECVALLMDKEARMMTNDGFSALMVAAINDNAECVELLLHRESALRNKNSETALCIAAEQGHHRCVRILAPEEAGLLMDSRQTALMKAAVKGHDRCVTILAKYECGYQDKWGWTALMYAANAGRVDCIPPLLGEAGAVTTGIGAISVPSTGMTALMFASRRGNTEIVSLLKPYELEMTDNDGHDALWHATNANQAAIVTLLQSKTSPDPSPGLSMPRQRKIDAAEEFNNRLCVICRTSQKCIVLQPCNHCCVCEGCKEHVATGTCPLCNGKVEGTLKIFI